MDTGQAGARNSFRFAIRRSPALRAFSTGPTSPLKRNEFRAPCHTLRPVPFSWLAVPCGLACGLAHVAGHDVNPFRLIMLLALAGLSISGFSQTFTTTFEGTENPLSEDGRWTNKGVHWTHIRKENGMACGTQTGTNTGIYKFNDSFAHLSGFPPDQEAWGEARIAKPNPCCIQELEILLRWTSSAHRATGYECFARCLSSSSSYVQIVRWEGPLGKFTYLADKRGTNYGLKNGDILKASIVGNVITVYINGVEKARVTDDTYRTGDPGIGEFLACDSGQGLGSNSDFGFASFTARGLMTSASASQPYPYSPLIESITWHWETHTTGALGSDLWPVAWGPDDHLYAAWGDGGGFGGSDSDGRVALGFARIEGGPEHWRGVNVNGGKDPEHPVSFPQKGKTTGVAFVDGVLYATVNLQDGTWPDVNHILAWSTDRGATWTKANWLFPKGAGSFQPAKFLTFGRDYGGVPEPLAGYVYIYGPKQSADRGSGNRLYLARAPKTKLPERAAHESFQGVDAAGTSAWVADGALAQPVFADPNGVTPGSVVYDPGLKRFLLTCFHVGPGQLGVFDAPNPWGPWTTIAYYEDWGKMGAAGEGLTCGFPQKWMSADGLTLWSIFSVYGDGAKQGINAHDRFNVVKATLQPRGKP